MLVIIFNRDAFTIISRIVVPFPFRFGPCEKKTHLNKFYMIHELSVIYSRLSKVAIFHDLQYSWQQWDHHLHPNQATFSPFNNSKKIGSN